MRQLFCLSWVGRMHYHSYLRAFRLANANPDPKSGSTDACRYSIVRSLGLFGRRQSSPSPNVEPFWLATTTVVRSGSCVPTCSARATFGQRSPPRVRPAVYGALQPCPPTPAHPSTPACCYRYTGCTIGNRYSYSSVGAPSEANRISPQ